MAKNNFVFHIWQYRYLFLVIFLVVFVVSFGLLAFIGIVPLELRDEGTPNLVSFINARADTGTSNSGVNVIRPNPVPGTAGETGEVPVRIVIDKIDVNQPILNPTTRDVKQLDEELKHGVVRYPGSGLLGDGNVFLFGHSTTFAVVHNQAYKALNHLDYLKAGDEVKVYSATRLYTYRITSVVKKSEGQAVIDLSGTTNKITISTCDSFSGIKQQRIIAEADLVSTIKIN